MSMIYYVCLVELKKTFLQEKVTFARLYGLVVLFGQQVARSSDSLVKDHPVSRRVRRYFPGSAPPGI